MHKCFITLVLPAVLSLFLSCSADKNLLARKYANVPAKLFSSYHFDSQSGFSERIMDVPPLLLDYLKHSDGRDNYSGYTLNENEKRLVVNYFEMLPKQFKSLIQEKLVGVYFVSNFMGGGMADFLVDNGSPDYAILIINPETLKHDLSEWVSYRDNSTFINDDPDIELRTDCGRTYRGLLHLIVHESAHIYDYFMNSTPYVEPDVRSYSKNSGINVITDRVWNDYNLPVHAYEFNGRDKLSFYGLHGAPTLKISDAAGIYERFSHSPFLSLYGSQNWAEDFAEIFSWYYITQKLKQPYRIEIRKKNTAVFVYNPIDNILVKKRYALIAEIIQ